MKISKILTDVSNNKFFENYEIKSLNKSYIENNVINIYPELTKQQWKGMGGALTEAVSYNMDKLKEEQKETFIDNYFGESGLRYNWLRISIASNDFCLKEYQYTTKKDLSDFSIEHDKKSIIPNLEKILLKKKAEIVASPWSPPSFMKTNHMLILGGKLKEKYYELYAEYLIKFLNAYKEENIDVSYLTMQNEPFATQIWESCTYTLEEQEKFIYNYLIPKLKEYQQNTKILVWDHNKESLYEIAKKLIKDEEYIAGIGYHWYTGRHFKNVELTKKAFPDKLVVRTEGCCGFSKYSLEEWMYKAEELTKDFIGDLNSGLNAYIDWNMLLDQNGGPSHKNNYCASPVILENDSNLIYTPIYYYYGQISKWFDIDSNIIETDTYREDLHVTACIKNNQIVIVVMNTSNEDINFNIKIGQYYFNDTLHKHSIATYI